MSEDPGGPQPAGLRHARPRCATTRGERMLRALASVFVGAFALSTLDNLWCAIPAAICSILLMVGAVTGWCPSDMLPRRVTFEDAPNAFGIPEAKDRVEV